MQTNTAPRRTHYDLTDAQDIFEHLRELDTHFERVELMQDHLPDWGRKRVERRLPMILNADADQLLRVLNYSDPTGVTATRSVYAQRGY